MRGIMVGVGLESDALFMLDDRNDHLCLAVSA